jgi:hypothetical protein
MTHSINEAFCTNMIGKEISYDVQPYYRGRMTITKCEPRLIKQVSGFDPEKGRTYTTYECFDVEGIVIEGSETPSLIAGVPQGHKVTNGKNERIVGVTFGQLYRATEKGQTIVKVSCG